MTRPVVKTDLINLLNRGIGSKMSDMEQVYSHQHVAQAHHSGLIIGTLAGSLVVTVFVAIAAVAVSPRLLLHPLSLTSEISVQPQTNQNAELGPAASLANSRLLAPQSSYGSAAQTATQFSHR